MPPRPILKGLPSSFVSSEEAFNPLPFSSCPTILDSPHVHFPPTPTLTSTEITHSSFIYDRAPIVVTPNSCALPERGGRKLIGSNNGNKGGLGYFHPHAKFQVDTVCDSSETASPTTIFNANVTVGNVNDCGPLGLFMKTRSGPMYDYDHEYDPYSSHDQHSQRAQHVISSFFDCSPESSDLGVFCSPPPPPPPPPPSSSSSIPHSSVNLSSWNVYNISTAPPSPSSTYNNNNMVKQHDKRKSSVGVDGKRRRKSNTHNRAEGDRIRDGTPRTTSNPSNSDSFELEGCLGGF